MAIMIKTNCDYICSIITLFLKSNEYRPAGRPPVCPQFKFVRVRILNKAQCYVNFSLKHSTADQTLFLSCVCGCVGVWLCVCVHKPSNQYAPAIAAILSNLTHLIFQQFSTTYTSIRFRKIYCKQLFNMFHQKFHS